MITERECCLCNPDAGGDSLCQDCKDKAASFDDIMDRLISAMRGISRQREACLLAEAMAGNPFEQIAQKTAADILQGLLVRYFTPELEQEAAIAKKAEEWRRQAQAATIQSGEAA